MPWKMSSAVIGCLVLNLLVVVAVDSFRLMQVDPLADLGSRADGNQELRRQKRHAATSASVSHSNRKPIIADHQLVAYGVDSQHQQAAVRRSKSDPSSRSPGTPLVRQKRIRRQGDGGFAERSIPAVNVNGGSVQNERHMALASVMAMQTAGKQSQQQQHQSNGLATATGAGNTKTRPSGGKNGKGNRSMDQKGGKGERGSVKTSQRGHGRQFKSEKIRSGSDLDEYALVERMNSYQAGKSRQRKITQQLQRQPSTAAEAVRPASTSVEAASEAKHRSGARQRQRQQKGGGSTNVVGTSYEASVPGSSPSYGNRQRNGVDPPAGSTRREKNDGRRRLAAASGHRTESIARGSSSGQRVGIGRQRSGSKGGAGSERNVDAASRRVVDISSAKTTAVHRPSSPSSAGAPIKNGNHKRTEDGEKRAKRSRKKRRLAAPQEGVAFVSGRLPGRKSHALRSDREAGSLKVLTRGSQRLDRKGDNAVRASTVLKMQHRLKRDDSSRSTQRYHLQERQRRSDHHQSSLRHQEDAQFKMKRSAHRLQPSQKSKSNDHRPNRK